MEKSTASHEDLKLAYKKAEEAFNAVKLSDIKKNPLKFFRLKKSPFELLRTGTLWLLSSVSNKPFKIRTQTFWNEKMTIIIPEMVSLRIHCYGFFETDLTRVLIERLNPGMTFFDIGSHFGFFTLLAAHLVGSAGEVHAFEPVPSTFAVLAENTSERANIHINNCAVFSEPKTLTILDYGIKYSAFNSLFGARLPHEVKARKEHRIASITIDDYIKQKRCSPDFVKIDAESAEFDILKGMEKTLDTIRPVISIEVGDYSIAKTDSKDLVSFLMDRDYVPYECREGRICEHAIRDRYQYENLLFLPR